MQIIERHLNNFLQKKLTPLLLIVVPLGQTFSSYICIKFRSSIPLPVFLMFPMMLFDALGNNIVLFTFASWIYSRSHEAIVFSIKQTRKYKKKSVLKKSIRACAPLKIRFGSNYMDRCTALVIQNNILNNTMSLLLIKNK
jgi:hypothetical protein